jgi:hypothetical protein
MKTAVYSWRVSEELKTSLEHAARDRRISISAVLDMAAQDWLMKSRAEEDDDARQSRLQKAAMECFGTLASGDATRSETVGQAVRERLRRRNGR